MMSHSLEINRYLHIPLFIVMHLRRLSPLEHLSLSLRERSIAHNIVGMYCMPDARRNCLHVARLAID